MADTLIMNVITILVLAVIVFGAVYGYVRGIVKQMGSVVAVILAVLACRAFGDTVSGWIQRGLDLGPVTAQGLGYAVVFLAVWFGIWLLARTLHAVVETVKLGWLNSGLGAIFMTFKFMMVLSLLMNLWSALLGNEWLQGGALVDWAMRFAPEVWGMMKVQLM